MTDGKCAMLFEGDNITDDLVAFLERLDIGNVVTGLAYLLEGLNCRFQFGKAFLDGRKVHTGTRRPQKGGCSDQN